MRIGALMLVPALLSSPAFATEKTGEFLNLSFTGDGSTPSAMAMFGSQQRQASSARVAASVSDRGDASWSYTVPLPPALLAPSLGISYNSATGAHSFISPGWTLETGMTVTRMTGRVRSQAYAEFMDPDDPTQQVYRVSGGGLDGLLLPLDDGSWQYASTGTLAVQALYDETTFTWTIRTGGTTTTLAPDATVTWDAEDMRPVHWHVTRMRDGKGNTVDFTWTQPSVDDDAMPSGKLESVEYGGTTDEDGDIVEPHLVQVLLEYDPRQHNSYQAVEGHVEAIEDRLVAIEIQSTLASVDFDPLLRIELDYDISHHEETLLEAISEVSPASPGPMLTTSATRESHGRGTRGGGGGHMSVSTAEFSDPGPSTGESLLVAEFVYSQLPDWAEATSSTDTAPILGASTSRERRAGEPSWSDTLASLTDASGDGLAEALATSTGPDTLEVYPHEIGTSPAEWGLGTHLWELPPGPPGWEQLTTSGTIAYEGDSLERTYTVRCDDTWSKSVAVRHLIDINSDGFQDIVDSYFAVEDAYIPEPALSYSSWDLCDSQDEVVGTDPAAWVIYFGSANGPAAEVDGVDVVAPVAYPRIGRMPVTKEVSAADINAAIAGGTLESEYPWLALDDASRLYTEQGDALVDLLDMDGDGWLDIVRAAPNDALDSGYHLDVWFHSGDADLGWDEDPVNVTSGLNLDMQLGALSQSRQYIAESSYQPQLVSWDQVTLQIGEVHTVRGLIDINGDGLLDFIDTTAVAGAWSVHLGTGSRAEGQGFLPDSAALSWQAPRAYISRTDEGRPAALVCQISETDYYTMPDSGGSGSSGVEWVDRVDFTDAFSEALLAYECVPDTDRAICGFTDDSLASVDFADPSIDTGNYGIAEAYITDKAGLSSKLLCSFTDSAPDSEGRKDWAAHGRPQLLLASLLDMDADGKPDLVDAESGQWWRNTGDGFSTASDETPSWFGVVGTDGTVTQALSASATRQTIHIHPESIATNPPNAEDEPTTFPMQTSRIPLWSVQDIDRDGMLDMVDVVDTRAVDDDGSITYGPRAAAGVDGTARPGLLIEIRQTYGATTELSYVSTATLWPTGTGVADHEMNAHRDVVEAVEVRDPVTGHKGQRRFTYEEGVCEQGQCLGFRYREVEEYVRDPDIHATNSFQFRSRTTTESLLDRDYAVPEQTSVYTNASDLELVALPDTSPDEHLEVVYEFTYDEVPLPDAATAITTTRWLASRGVTEYPVDPTHQERLSSVEYVRNELGYPTEITHIAVACPAAVGISSISPKPHLPGGSYKCQMAHQDDVRVEVTYVTDDPVKPTIVVPSSISTVGYDTALDVTALVEYGRFAYDDGVFGEPVTDGLLTAQYVDADPSGALGVSETLEWFFTRTDRGAVERVDAPGGRVTATTFTAGDALPLETIVGDGAVSHATSYEYDGFGRVVATTDPNDVLAETEYDRFGRPLRAYVTPFGGSRYEVARYAYDDTLGAAYVSVTRSNYQTAGGSPLERVEYAVLDGFGDVVQAWTPAETTTEWLVQETIRDITGSVVRTSYPHRETAFSTAVDTTRESRFTTWNSLDAFGRPLVTWEDYDADLGETSYDYSRPGWTVTTDALGYTDVHHLDTRGRLVAVFQGQGSTLQQTATWEYDVRGRVTGFEDASDHVYAWTYDGAGRLLDASRSPDPMTTPSVWFSYEYEGPTPVAMYEGESPSRGGGGTLVVQWEYDALGRMTNKAVLDRSTWTFDQYTWSWDAQWKGARDAITDPAGVTTYTYEDEFTGEFGAMGRVTTVNRDWTGLGESATFSYTWDLEGNARTTVWPTGATVVASHTTTGWLFSHEATWATGDATVTYEYDEWGKPAGWFGGEIGVFFADAVRNTPTRLSELTWQMPHGGDRYLAYTWKDNGLLDYKEVGGSGGAIIPSFDETMDYEYDEWRRVTELALMAGTAETYSYDAIGNLTSMTRDTEAWHYADGPFSETAGRTSSTGEEEEHTWDTTGRMETWSISGPTRDIDRTFTYDGASRLVGIHAIDGTAIATTSYSYDVDDQMVLETHGGTSQILRFQGYRFERVSGETIEKLLPMMSLIDGESRWTMADYDGHAIGTYDATGVEESLSLLGVYGLDVSSYSAGDWPIDAFHGSDPDTANELVHFGARHMILRDGSWIQPEPLLYVGISPSAVLDPERLAPYRYARNNPTQYVDATGGEPDAVDATGGESSGFETVLEYSAWLGESLGLSDAYAALIENTVGWDGADWSNGDAFGMNPVAGVTQAIQDVNSGTVDTSSSHYTDDSLAGAGGLLVGVGSMLGGGLAIEGSGPAKGFIEVSSNVKSTAYVQKFAGKGTDFIYDSASKRFIMGNNVLGHDGCVAAGGLAKGSSSIVGGRIRRDASGRLVTSEHSGHYRLHWTDEIRKEFDEFMKANGIDQVHTRTWDDF